MVLSKIDQIFELKSVGEADVDWRNIQEDVFSIHGVFYSEEDTCYRRIPKEISQQISARVEELSAFSAGGRIRFITDSPYVAVKAIIRDTPLLSNLSLGAQSGFAVYANGVFEGNLRPEFENVQNSNEGKYVFSGLAAAREQGLRNIDIYMPMYNCVYKVYIGLKKGCRIRKAKPYRYEEPVVFYGSSITQGGAASHSGNGYVARTCRALNVDYLNLGFWGNAKGEPIMAAYLSSLKARAIVLDYDFNAPDVEWLKNTHFPLYEKIRKEQLNVPILLMTRPNFLYDPKNNELRRAVVYDSYLKAKEQGDELVEYIDGETLLGKDWDSCTVDNCHPNDLGFYRMAQKVVPVLKKILSKNVKI